MKIAIIGSGISGLVVGNSLFQDHDIDLFESNTYVGGHTNTINVEVARKRYSIDTGFIVFNNWTYPNFIKLIEKSGVQYQKTDMGFSVSSEPDNLEYSGSSVGALFAQKRNLFRPSHYRMLLEILRFNKEAPKILTANGDRRTLGDYLLQNKYSRYFIDNYIVPMGSAIWSTDPADMFDFPAQTFIRFFSNHGLLSVNNRPTWYVIKGGSSSYVKKLIKPFSEKIKLNTPVKFVDRSSGSVRIVTANGKSHFYDKVFFACHSDQALAMLKDPSKEEKQILGNIRYQHNEAVLHTDTSLLPKRRSAWAAWNYHIGKKSNRVVLTYNMNILQNFKSETDFCVTLNNTEAIAPEKVMYRVDYEHPVFDQAAINAQSRWSDISGRNNSFYCGAYWGYGFHEDGVNSALRAVRLFNEQDYSHEELYLRRAY